MLSEIMDINVYVGDGRTETVGMYMYLGQAAGHIAYEIPGYKYADDNAKHDAWRLVYERLKEIANENKTYNFREFLEDVATDKLKSAWKHITISKDEINAKVKRFTDDELVDCILE